VVEHKEQSEKEFAKENEKLMEDGKPPQNKDVLHLATECDRG